MKIPFYTKVRDSVTRFEGTVTAYCVYATGCIQYQIAPKVLKDGVPQREYWLDEQRIEVMESKTIKKSLVSKVASTLDDFASNFVSEGGGGGPQDHPINSNPPGLNGYDE